MSDVIDDWTREANKIILDEHISLDTQKGLMTALKLRAERELPEGFDRENILAVIRFSGLLNEV